MEITVALAIIATGFYRLGLWDDEPVDRLQAYYDGLDDVIVTSGQAFLGLFGRGLLCPYQLGRDSGRASLRPCSFSIENVHDR